MGSRLVLSVKKSPVSSLLLNCLFFVSGNARSTLIESSLLVVGGYFLCFIYDPIFHEVSCAVGQSKAFITAFCSRFLFRLHSLMFLSLLHGFGVFFFLFNDTPHVRSSQILYTLTHSIAWSMGCITGTGL